MKNMNIGIVNLMISNKLKDSYFSNTLIEESKKTILDFFDVVKNSPILQLEFKVFNNLENKHIEDDLAATRYIDNNIKLFEVYTIQEIDKEREKLLPFVSETQLSIDDKRIELYSAIDRLITESLNDITKIDVDAIHESFMVVLNHIKSPKNIANEDADLNMINEEVIEIAVNKFNKKYESLNDDDKNLLQKLINSSDKEKEDLLETLKNDMLIILEGLNKDMAKDNIAKAIQKIKEMVYNRQKVDDDIISLYELKKELL
jgi:hypothetical protein